MRKERTVLQECCILEAQKERCTQWTKRQEPDVVVDQLLQELTDVEDWGRLSDRGKLGNLRCLKLFSQCFSDNFS